MDGWRYIRSLTLGLLAATAASAEAATLTRGPYLQLLTQGSVTVVWRTDMASACSLAIRAVGGNATVINGSTGTECVISVTGLTAGSRYAYVPRSNGSALIGESTFKVGDPSAPYSFIVVGDTGDGGSDQMAVRDRMAASPGTEFIVSTGDMIYEDGEAADFNPKFFSPYRDFIRQMMFWPCLGNHDIRTSSGQPWRDAFWTPANNAAQSENYYSFDYANAHVVVLNSNSSVSPGSAQYNFLDQDLAASNATWKFVAFHHPIYSSSHHGSDTDMRADLVPLFDEHGVDIVFMGHDHMYERTKPMLNDQPVAAGSGTVYITTGGGGRELYEAGAESFTAYSESALHFTRVRVNGTTLTTEMVRADGAVRDSMTLVKGSSPPPARCGDGMVQAPEACDNGPANSDTVPNACRTTCTRPTCGDGVVDRGEECERPGQGECNSDCQLGGCTNGGAAACDDGNPCTDDRCNLNTGSCTHTNNSAACEDGNACTTGDTCRSGSCAAGSAVTCDDGNACTIDSCSPSTGCTTQPAPGCCTSDADCDDANPCTIDSCAGSGGCHNDPISQAPAARSASRGLPECQGQAVPAAIDKLARRAGNMLARSANDGNPNRARKMSRRAAKMLKRAQHIIAVATDRGRISQECATAVITMLAEVKELPSCLTARLYPIADTYIEAGGEAGWDHGKSNHLDVDAGPFGITYLKFDLGKINSLSKAELELYVSNASDDGGRIYRIPYSGWVEGRGNGIDSSSTEGNGLKWTDVDTNGNGKIDAGDTSPYMPDPAQMVGGMRTVVKGRSYRIDVTAAFKDGPGIYTLAVMNGSSNGTTFCSREHPSTDQRPVLHVTRTDGGPPSTPPVCGDDVRTAPEQCDGTSDAACPGQCAPDCTCIPPPPPPPPPGADGFSCLSQAGPTITLSGEYTKRYSNRSMADSTKIDARAGTFISSSASLYPIVLGGGSGACIAGGRVQGNHDRNASWEDMHDINHAGVRFESPNFTVDGVRIDNVEDGVRPVADNFTIRQVWMSYIRDDCVENDHVFGGLIEDSLFDGCYVVYASRPTANIISDGYYGRNETVVMRNNLLRLEPQPKPRKGLYSDFGSGNIFKMHDLSPKMELHGNIFMAEKLGQGGKDSMLLPKNLGACSNNVMVWLGPGDYPISLPSCVTVTKDRSVWDNAVAAWKANHPHVRP